MRKMLRLVPMKTLGAVDDEKVQEVFDKIVRSDRDRIAALVRTNFAYGATMAQLQGDGVRLYDEARTATLVAELVGLGLLVIFDYKNHDPCYFHKDHILREPTAREVLGYIL